MGIFICFLLKDSNLLISYNMVLVKFSWNALFFENQKSQQSEFRQKEDPTHDWMHFKVHFLIKKEGKWKWEMNDFVSQCTKNFSFFLPPLLFILLEGSFASILCSFLYWNNVRFSLCNINFSFTKIVFNFHVMNLNFLMEMCLHDDNYQITCSQSILVCFLLT